MSGVFISYRKEEDGDTAELLERGLKDAFGAANVFRDQSDLPLGKDFRKLLWPALQSSTILLAVIGPTWLDARHADGGRKIDHEDDFVRRELECAIERDIPVAMVLTRNAKEPSVQELPPSLERIRHHQRIRLRPGHAATDIGNLVDRLAREYPLLADLQAVTEREGDTDRSARVIINNPVRSPIATGRNGIANYNEGAPPSRDEGGRPAPDSRG